MKAMCNTCVHLVDNECSARKVCINNNQFEEKILDHDDDTDEYENEDLFIPCDSPICAYCANKSEENCEECELNREYTEFVGVECYKTEED